jgi:vacuolar-type H+-ATPase subunit I/STV1
MDEQKKARMELIRDTSGKVEKKLEELRARRNEVPEARRGEFDKAVSAAGGRLDAWGKKLSGTLDVDMKELEEMQGGLDSEGMALEDLARSYLPDKGGPQGG